MIGVGLHQSHLGLGLFELLDSIIPRLDLGVRKLPLILGRSFGILTLVLNHSEECHVGPGFGGLPFMIKLPLNAARDEQHTPIACQTALD